MAVQHGRVTDAHIWPDDTEGTNDNALADLCSWVNL